MSSRAALPRRAGFVRKYLNQTRRAEELQEGKRFRAFSLFLHALEKSQRAAGELRSNIFPSENVIKCRLSLIWILAALQHDPLIFIFLLDPTRQTRL